MKLCEITKMAYVEFGTGKSVFILAIVAGCFAILWPKIFYPMLVGPQAPKRPVDVSGGCCDVIFEKDVDAIRVLTEMCTHVNGMAPGVSLTPSGVASCRSAVLQACEIDIASFLNEQARLGRSYRQILDELRSFNTSVCLRRNFGVTPGSLGAPRRMRTWGATTSRHLRQERPPHLRPEGLHPALRERGRAIPASHVVPKVAVEVDPVAAIKPPLPGMRPPMGAAGHVVPPPKTGGTMGVVMPLYTIGIVIFFMYTMMKMFVRKNSGDDGLSDFQPDPEFRRVVFADEYLDPQQQKTSRQIRQPSPPVVKATTPDITRLGWKERDTRDIEINQLRRRLEETEKAMERIVAQMGKVPRVAEATRSRTSPRQGAEKPGDADTKEEQHIQATEDSSQQVKPLEIITNVDTQVDSQSRILMSNEPAEESSIAVNQEKSPTQIASEQEEHLPFAPLNQVPELAPNEITKQSAPEIVEEIITDDQRELETLPGNDDGPCVRVLGVETRARAEGGVEWRPPPSPTFGLPHSRPATPISPIPPDLEPHNIFLEGTLPSNSQLLVEDAATELLDTSQQDPLVILSGKMTLSLITVDQGRGNAAVVGEAQISRVANVSTPESTLLDVETAIIDNSSVDGDEEREADPEPVEEFTLYTTANTAGQPSANAVNSAGRNEDADDTAADVSAQDLLDDQEDLQDEYDAIWGAMEMEEDDDVQLIEADGIPASQHQR